MKFINWPSTLCLWLAVIFIYSPLSATDYYVDPSGGNNANDGRSATAAFRSLSRISSMTLRPGDTVFLMDGTHANPGQTVLVIRDSGTEQANITITNFPGHTPTVEFDTWAGIELINGASYITFRGIQVKGARSRITNEEALAQPGGCQDPAGEPSGYYNGVGILAVGPNLRWANPATTGDEVPSHITIEDCEVFDCTSSGIALQQADYVTVKNNKIYDNCWFTIYGTSGLNMYQFINTDGTTGYHNEITNNLFWGNQLIVPQLPTCGYFDGNALIIDDFRHTQTENYRDDNRVIPSYTGKTLVANNVAVENGGSGLHFFLSEYCYVYNNTLAGNAFQNGGQNGNADLRIGRCFNFEVKNNILDATNQMHEVSENISLDYTHNLQRGPGRGAFAVDCQECITTTEDFFANTDISDPAPYIISERSLAVDQGLTIDDVIDDYLGEPRSASDPYDLGAYELPFDTEPCPETTYYADFDGDGFGDPLQPLVSCVQPADYVINADDLCPTIPSTNPQDANGNGTGDACEDDDQDGIPNGLDCDPNDASVIASTRFYEDVDGDGFGDRFNFIQACSRPAGYVTNPDDNCPTVANPDQADIDADGIGDACDELADGNNSFWLEAECAQVGEGWTIVGDEDASRNQYAVWQGEPSIRTPPEDVAANYLRFVVEGMTPGDYRLFGRASTASMFDDSYWVRVNDGDWFLWLDGFTLDGSWSWNEVQEGPYNLTESTNTIDIAYRETEARLDKLFFTAAQDLPTGLGGYDPTCAGQPTAPVAIATSPITEGIAPLAITLDGTNSFDEDGEIVDFTWTVNDLTVTGPAPSIVLAQSGDQLITLTVTDNDGLKTSTTVTVEVNPSLNNLESHWLEAECGVVGSGWSILADPLASNGQFVVWPLGNSASSPPADELGNQLRFIIDIANPGAYRLFGRASTATFRDDSFWVRVNGGAWSQWSEGFTLDGTWSWNEVQAGPYVLNAGPNVIEIAYREDDSRLDKLFLTNEDFQPIGMGGNSENCSFTLSPPVAAATASVTSGFGPLTISLDGSASTDADGDIVSYDWTFPGGTASGVSPEVILTENGNNIITLQVTDNDGLSSRFEFNVQVNTPVSSVPGEYWLEAECGTIGSDWTIVVDADASGGSYVNRLVGDALSSPTAVTEESILEYRIQNVEAGEYYLFARMRGLNASDDSFWARINGGPWIRWNISRRGPSFRWNTFPSQTVNLTEGENVLEIHYREDNSQLDKLVFKRSEIVPDDGFGPMATNCSMSQPDDRDGDGITDADDNCPDTFNPDQVLTTFYRDLDGDGAGDPASMLEACTQPNGYVLNTDDTCPNDPLKTEPGDCGCGFNEFSCIDPSDGPQAAAGEYWLEAECALVGNDWAIISSPEASGGAYVDRLSGNAFTAPADPDVDKIVAFQLDGIIAQEYFIFGHIRARDGGDNSVWVRINGGAWVRWNMNRRGEDFRWNFFPVAAVPLEENGTLIEIHYREDGTALDKLLLKPSQDLPEVGFGPLGSNCSIPDVVDTDGDGVPDNVDNCPAVPNADQAMTIFYADVDGDGFGDANDTVLDCIAPASYVMTAGDDCPTDAAKVTPGDCGCNVPEGDCTDSDNDGIPDVDDNCPTVANPDQAITIFYADVDADGAGDANDTVLDCIAPAGYVTTAGDDCPTDAAKVTPGDCGCNVPEGDCTDSDNDGIPDVDDNCPTVANPDQRLLTFYADVDEDGFGDANVSQEACFAPIGYVGQAGDTCPEDPDKAEPGECGCGQAEDTCSDTGGDTPCDAPAWDATAIYDVDLTEVTHEGKAYHNLYYASRQVPGNGDPWVLIEVCDGSTVDCSSAAIWDPNTAYPNAGTLVSSNGRVYETQYYVQGQEPETSPAYRFLGYCEVTLARTAISTMSSSSIAPAPAQELKVYPTIITDAFTAEVGKELELTVLDNTGRQIAAWTLQAGRHRLTLPRVTAGLYYVRGADQTGDISWAKLIVR